jgi:hypothetical protein
MGSDGVYGCYPLGSTSNGPTPSSDGSATTSLPTDGCAPTSSPTDGSAPTSSPTDGSAPTSSPGSASTQTSSPNGGSTQTSSHATFGQRVDEFAVVFAMALFGALRYLLWSSTDLDLSVDLMATVLGGTSRMVLRNLTSSWRRLRARHLL